MRTATLAEDRQTLLTVDGAGKTAKAAALARLESSAALPLANRLGLEQVPEATRNDPRFAAGFFVFFKGRYQGWTSTVEFNAWGARPGCIALSTDGARAYVAKGGSYQEGAERWEAC